MDSRERQELVDEIVQRLDRRRVGAGVELLDLMRTEQGLMDALKVVRRQINAIVNGVEVVDA